MKKSVVGVEKFRAGETKLMWNEEEMIKFMKAVKKHGRNWKKLAEYMGNRTSIACS